ncbi:MAG: hypothetical protein AAF581_20395 [Planctomycetota bacterium]
MNQERLPEDRLFLTYARTFSREGAQRAADGDPTLQERYDIASILSEVAEMQELPVSDFVTRYGQIAPTVPAEVRSYLLLFYLHHQQTLVNLSDLEQVEAAVDNCPGDPAIDALLVQCMRGYQTVLRGRVVDAVNHLSEQLVYVDQTKDTLYGQYVRALLHRNLGVAYQRAGDFHASQNQLAKASEISSRQGFLLEISCNWHLGSLQWASGQHRLALETHKNERIRELARATNSTNLLLHSHISAAKCALDLKATQAAAAELQAAQDLLATTENPWPEVHGYMLLYRGECEVQQEAFETGLTLLKEAQSYFEALDPRHFPGALEAKISLAHFALFERDYKTAMAIFQKLLHEAEEHGCLEARSRLLVLEAYLFITEDPPLADAYADLLTRVHLINNPALLFRALGNLYTYALEYLEEPDQLFLLERIRNLRPTLEKSCYNDLYQRYVVERYQYAIENRLARYVDEDWVEWNDGELAE